MINTNADGLLFNTEIYANDTKDNDDVLSAASQIGDICEQQFGLDAMKRGYEVFMPIGHATKVDVAIKKNGTKFVSLQIKKAYYNNSGYRIHCGSTPGRKDKGGKGHKYTYGDFDVLGGYLVEANIWVFLDIHSIVAGSEYYQWKPGIGQHENNWDIFDKYL